jgi:lysozyme
VIPVADIPQTYSPAAVALVQQAEGLSLVPYCCPGGHMTIGYGATRLPSGKKVTMATPPITKEQAVAMLHWDLDSAAAVVRKRVKVPLTQGQFDALTSFVFNNKLQPFYDSTLLRLLNAGDYVGCAGQFHRWVHVVKPDGTVVEEPGLVTRRAAEKAMFEKGD